jgi:tetratricopeptide (TPR) repeat protein
MGYAVEVREVKIQPGLKLIRSRTRLLPACLIVLSFSVPTIVHAHPDLELRIQLVTEEIEDNPGDARLLVFRGELHEEHEDWGAAWYDFDLAATEDPSYIAANFHRGRLLYTLGEYDEAEYVLKTFLRNARTRDDPSLPAASAHLVLGELLETTGRWAQAAVQYDKGIRLSPKTNPGFYMARARALVKANGSNYGPALKGLDERLSKSPGLYSLQEYAIGLELERGNVNGADARIKHLIDTYPGLPRWRLRLAEVQHENGRDHDARRTYRAAQEFIKSMPGHSRAKMHRNGITARIERGLDELE